MPLATCLPPKKARAVNNRHRRRRIGCWDLATKFRCVYWLRPRWSLCGSGRLFSTCTWVERIQVSDAVEPSCRGVLALHSENSSPSLSGSNICSFPQFAHIQERPHLVVQFAFLRFPVVSVWIDSSFRVKGAKKLARHVWHCSLCSFEAARKTKSSVIPSIPSSVLRCSLFYYYVPYY